MTAPAEPKETLLSQSQLAERGWTKAMIARLLPNPILKTNPRYKSAAPMKLWREEDVRTAEGTPEYAESKVKAQKRKASADKAVRTKTDRLKSDADEFLKTVTVEIIPDRDLRVLAVEARQNWYDWTEQWYRSTDGADEETVARWIVNYIRHNLTHYDDKLLQMKGKTGRGEVYPAFKKAILMKIAEAYPKYQTEINRQIEFTY